MVHRLYITRKDAFSAASDKLGKELSLLLGLSGLASLKLYYRYDMEGLDQEQAQLVGDQLLAMRPRDEVQKQIEHCDFLLGIEMLPGQFDQRSDSVKLCLSLLYPGLEVEVRSATFYCFNGSFSEQEKQKIRSYLINAVESQEASVEPLQTLAYPKNEVPKAKILTAFRLEQDLAKVKDAYSLAMDEDDLAVVQDYYHTQGRDPFLTELKVIDTYWSDHCRHTTFLTELDEISIEDDEILQVYHQYLEGREKLGLHKAVSLMDMATIAAKQLKSEGLLEMLDISEEINACSVSIDVQTEDETIPYLLQFKNETHNHPTEIEPFGGAATCIGGAIRDPLSGRAYVYQGMRISGSADPTRPLSETRKGKLSQRTIAQNSALGFSSYGNQIGLATSIVEEIYHPGFLAKHMELGFVIAAARKSHVRRETPKAGDVIILVGGRTGRDGCGGATGSSKSHDKKSIETCSAEVQKGNAPEERKIQRLMLDPKATSMIKRCNDFGAGGVSVAIGELAGGLDIDLGSIKVKYQGLDGTELAISESQERMAMVVAKEDADAFIALAQAENLEATIVAKVTDEQKLVMRHHDEKIVEIDRSLLDSNGATKRASVYIPKREKQEIQERTLFTQRDMDCLLKDLNLASKQSLSEMFDSTIGSCALLASYGGKTQSTPIQAMASLIPTFGKKTSTASLVSYGYDPYAMQQDPFSGAFQAVTHSLAKVVASGGDWQQTFLTFQEYFCKVGDDPKRWGLVVSALLGAYKAQRLFGKAAIGGKDSMSGSFDEIDVPPTLVSFAVSVTQAPSVLSCEFKSSHSLLYLLESEQESLPELFIKVSSLVHTKQVLSCYALGYGGIAMAVTKMSLGNWIGCKLDTMLDLEKKRYGSFLVESKTPMEDAVLIGHTTEEEQIDFGCFNYSLAYLKSALDAPLGSVYTAVHEKSKEHVPTLSYTQRERSSSRYPKAKPSVLIPVFAGTNCEYDIKNAYSRCGADVEMLVINTMDRIHVAKSVEQCRQALRRSQILFIPGGFSAADEPDGSGKFIAAFFKHPHLKQAISDLLEKQDGLIGGICNGFQALLQLGLFTHERVVELTDDDPLLIQNTLGRHISRFVSCRVSSTLSPWMSAYTVGDTFRLPISHGEGRFHASHKICLDLAQRGQIAAQYVDEQDKATGYGFDNPNGSLYAVEALSSRDGKVFGRMAHSERMIENLYRNVPSEPDLGLFWSSVRYFQ